MDKEVLIHVRGLQTMDADGEQEPLEIVVPGQYYFRNGSPQERCGQCSYGF